MTYPSESAVQKAEPRLQTGAETLGLKLLRADGWDECSWLGHSFSTRPGGGSFAYLARHTTVVGPSANSLDSSPEDGDLNLGITPEDLSEVVQANRRLYVEAVTGQRDTPLVVARQVHSNRIALLTGDLQGEELVADGLITDLPGLLLGILTADCVPVLIADSEHKAVGAFHAGWRGTAERIVELGIRRMCEEYGSDPKNIVAAIGPSIGRCCYTVGDELRRRFEANFDYASELFALEPQLRANDSSSTGTCRLTLDLVEANRRQLLSSGLSASSIWVSGQCTSCNQNMFFSHRASGGRTGRMMAVIGIC